MDDLFQALNMFQNGVHELAIGDAVRGANQQVQQIKDSALKDDEKRSQLQGIANQMVAHLVSQGTPATTIDALSRAFAPPQYKDEDEMYKQGLLTNNPELQQEGKQLQDFRNNPKLANIQAKAMLGAQSSYAKAEEKRNEFNIKQFRQFGQDLDSTAASSRSSFGVAGLTEQKANRLTALIGSPENIKSATPADMTLLAEGLANMVKGGVATEKEIKDLAPRTSGTDKASLAQYFNSNPAAAQSEGFIKRYQDLIGREKVTADEFVAKTILKRATNNLKLHDRDSEQFLKTTARSLSDATGKDISPDDLQIDDKKGVIYKPSKSSPVQSSAAPQLIPVNVTGPDGKPIKALKDPKTGKLYAA